MANADSIGFGLVSASWVRRLRQRQRVTRSLAPRPPSPGRPITPGSHAGVVRESVRDDSDPTPADLRARLGVRVSISALAEYLRRIELVSNKSPRAAEQDRPDVTEKRAPHASQMPGLGPAKLVFLDETGANTNITRRSGHGPRQARLVDAVPQVTGRRCSWRPSGPTPRWSRW